MISAPKFTRAPTLAQVTNAGATTEDNLDLNGQVDFNSAISFDGSAGTTNASFTPNTATDQFLLALGVDHGRQLVIGESTYRTRDFDHGAPTNPTVYVHSAEDPNTDNTEYATVAYNDLSISGDAGSFCGLKSITEEVTVAVGTGSTPTVDSSSNLAPAMSNIVQVVSRITQAPGGGATTVMLGRTNGGNADEYAQGTAVALGTTTNMADDGDGNTAQFAWNASADTIKITTDADVTDTDMKIRITTFYIQTTEHTG